MRAGTLLAAVLFGLLSSPAHAQSVKQLKRELAAKKAQLAKLERRVRELEARPWPAPAAVLAQPAPVPVVPPGAPVQPPGPPAEDDAARALERTLVREGALVLAPFTYEVTPQLNFAHWDTIQEPTVRNSYGAALSARMGLPWQSQVAVSLPYVYDQLRNGGSASGLGDAGILFSKGLMRESDYGVNLIGSAGWTSPTRNGSALSPIPYVSGFQGGLTASKRLDPLVIFGGVSYFSSASREVSATRVTGSDVIGARIGGSLAVSPSTSVTAGVNASYVTDPGGGNVVVANGSDVAGPPNLLVEKSDRVLSTADVGISTIVGHRTLLNVTAQFGLTGHVPDFRLITSLPIRF
jgi:hypothetical protein